MQPALSRREDYGAFSFPSAPAPKAHERICRTHETISSLSFTGGFFFSQLGIQLATVFMHRVPELARVRRGPALPRSPKVLGEITQFIFSGCRMPFPLHSSSLRYLITMFPIHMSGHFTCVRAP